MFVEVQAHSGYRLKVDLPGPTLTSPDDETFDFELDAARKLRLLAGLDDFGLKLQDADLIRQFETQHRQQQHWLFSSP